MFVLHPVKLQWVEEPLAQVKLTVLHNTVTQVHVKSTLFQKKLLK